MISTSAVIALLIWIAVQDIRQHKIKNRSVLVVLLLYIPAQGGLGFPHWGGDLLAGGTLFGSGFVLWLMRALGAGDAKLMLPLGLHLGIDALPPFAALIITASLAYAIASALSCRFQLENRISIWLRKGRETGKTPYGPILVFATVPLLFSALISSS